MSLPGAGAFACLLASGTRRCLPALDSCVWLSHMVTQSRPFPRLAGPKGPGPKLRSRSRMPKQQPNGTPGKKPVTGPVWLLLGLAAALLAAMTRKAYGWPSPRQTNGSQR
jgi:hypothetical protein